MKPRIAVTGGTGLRGSTPYLAVPTSYLAAIENSGGFPFVASLIKGGSGEVLAMADGLLLTGGDDVDPALYGQALHEKTAGVDAPRDAVETELARVFYRAGKPILGICRGIQVLAVALGGSLHQHIPDLNRVVVQHADSRVRHAVKLEEGSALRALYGKNGIMANSTHHQSVAVAPEGFAVTALSLEVVVEGIEGGNALGVQWHPERMLGEGHACLFDEFIRRCMVAQAAR
jgi:putative glutamine amidotransferase